ncbi:1,4-dihydroxy-2-naphthoate polyprenyltransferase [Chlorobium phaeovibrioides]|uniref:1,4-dihydroxy-2-naphthoate octaprenyltransferase n=1 Tax=Chlorobium phaeovibrioides TaxID=1094 RepID=A0A3S0L250_CHLPH|nr:1,4-dihydroxy-2-naphthoate polyprenyltransferase [Chlorobium phaeovibrioides]KAA6232969.1 1,4-dihydroxy-2-naphthoate polyprenyltransferase [Chlorobium phaeovibrioides]MWV53937.1 1,4-dihydroxy-2-naphthoate polyprenyltransferase [Chlorobium phaeovibrioides]QEQ56638.1 1,4-dihydroxy-2-naphthoate polyprenyltransferase [Chlorobium phaeovibrioides]RTY35284.1 1,4-dihydroxy-2-naphthoate polyprenyltransferase [Chlorobium phaeovibrioides]RTY38830.1 1,4-dihydroxy-2-naphthoate polyprenyltransferase [Chl
MLEAWVLAVRPRTLPAGAVPVVLGSALAAEAGSFVLLPALVALCCALGIQVATNFINEIYDFRKGADTAERLGPTRTVAAGLISENTMVRAAALLLGAVFLLGLYLVFIGGWPILLIGMLSILFAWAYTGGPRPIAYSGLGDLFVFVFFGLVAVGGTYFVQASALEPRVLLAAVVPGAFSVNILLCNNIRDIATDRKVGKMTLPARIGAGPSRMLYLLLTVIAYLVPVLLWLSGSAVWVLLSLLSLPLAVSTLRTLYGSEGRELNSVLAATGKLMTIHGALLSAGLLFN